MGPRIVRIAHARKISDSSSHSTQYSEHNPKSDATHRMSPLVDTIHISPSSTETAETHYLIFHITGNPGLIGYYHAFLNQLQPLLQETATEGAADSKGGEEEKRLGFHIYGRSLRGFDIHA